MKRLFLTTLASLAMLASTAQADVFPGSSNRYLGRGEIAGLGCRSLWVARNEIYARNGYCFRTRRAINYFGNTGCWTRNPRLNRFERANVARIKAREQALGCLPGGGGGGALGGGGAAAGGGGGGGLWNMSCQRLWVARNSIYKRNGYCFRTRRAINYFGNAGCWTRNPRLSRAEQRRVDAIRRVERAKGCR